MLCTIERGTPALAHQEMNVWRSVDAHEKWPEFEHRKLPKNEHFGGRGVVRACPILANDLIIREINLHWAC